MTWMVQASGWHPAPEDGWFLIDQSEAQKILPHAFDPDFNANRRKSLGWDTLEEALSDARHEDRFGPWMYPDD